MTVRLAAIREHTPSIVVAGLSSAFGVGLIATTKLLSQVIRFANLQSGTLDFILSFISFIFIAIALYVGAIVTANTFSTIIAGRVRTIALMRLIGSSAAAQRREVAKEGLLVGVVGSLLGAFVGAVLTLTVVPVGEAFGIFPLRNYSLIEPSMLVPMIAVTITTVASSWIGSRRVLTVSPVGALGLARETTLSEQSGRRRTNVIALVLFIFGGALLVTGVLVGLVSPLGVFVALPGGIISFTGIVLGANAIMPRVLRVIGRLFGSTAPARLAQENAVRYPERSARTTIGLVIGVTLITTFAVTVETYKTIIEAARQAQPATYLGVEPVLTMTITVFSILMGFSALIAAVGLINSLSLNVIQRTKELGLLRALGFTPNQMKRMVLLESVQLTIAALIVGLILGAFYGWAGAQSLIGSIQGSPGLVAPTIPFPLIGVLCAGAALVAIVASVAPSARAARVSPVEAMSTN